MDVLTGNQNAYAEIVRRYEQRVRSYCLNMLTDLHAADDAAQEIFIKAFQSLAKFKGNSSFSTWIYRIAAHHCLDILRKRSRKKEQSLENLIEDQGDAVEKLLAVSNDETLSHEQSEIIRKFVAELPDKFREVIVLREFNGLSYQEIGDVLGCPIDAVKSRLRRARQELQLKLKHFRMAGDV